MSSVYILNQRSFFKANFAKKAWVQHFSCEKLAFRKSRNHWTHKHINFIVRALFETSPAYTLTRGGSPIPYSCWHTHASVPLETSQLIAKGTRVDCHWARVILIRERHYSAILWRSEIGTHTGCKGVDQLLKAPQAHLKAHDMHSNFNSWLCTYIHVLCLGKIYRFWQKPRRQTAIYNSLNHSVLSRAQRFPRGNVWSLLHWSVALAGMLAMPIRFDYVFSGR